MKLNNLKPAVGSTHSRRRIGRGPGSGLGGTSTRGHKGAKDQFGLVPSESLIEIALRHNVEHTATCHKHYECHGANSKQNPCGAVDATLLFPPFPSHPDSQRTGDIHAVLAHILYSIIAAER